MSGIAPIPRPSLAPATAERLRARLPVVAEQTVAAVVAGVPGYAAGLDETMGANIEGAVQMALGGFVRLAEDVEASGPVTPLQPALVAAYRLGQGEALGGRSVDALLSAYRLGARVAWRELSAVLVADGLPAGSVAQFAELVFAYIDELSAASVAGHTDEQETTGRVRERYLERLGRHLLEAAPDEVLIDAADRAGWDPPTTLTAVLLGEAHVRPALAKLDARVLRVPADLADAADAAVLLVPDAARPRLLAALTGLPAVAGPTRPWREVAASFDRARRAQALGLGAGSREPVDTEVHLATLLVRSDAEALDDLRRRVLAPLSELRPATAERLEQTLLSWLLHQGRREEVAAELTIHPQTVRYRMTQLRELYGEALRDPATVLDLVVALSGSRCAQTAGSV